MVAFDVGLPLALSYGLRLAGVNQWLALVLGAAAPLVRIVLTAVKARRLETLSAFTPASWPPEPAIGLIRPTRGCCWPARAISPACPRTRPGPGSGSGPAAPGSGAPCGS